MKTKRLFVAIDLPDAMKADLSRLDPEIKGTRWTKPDQMHLTLGFFGSVASDAEAVLHEKLSAIDFGAFFLPVVGLGTFPSKGMPKIVWIGVGRGHPHLFQIHQRVQEAALAAGLETDLRPWHPHITLARCSAPPMPATQKFLKKHAEHEAGLVRVEQFVLYSSKLTPAGSVYTRELAIKAR